MYVKSNIKLHKIPGADEQGGLRRLRHPPHGTWRVPEDHQELPLAHLSRTSALDQGLVGGLGNGKFEKFENVNQKMWFNWRIYQF